MHIGLTWRRLIPASVLALLAVAAFAATAGAAYPITYCGWYVAPHSACSQVPDRHTYEDNGAIGSVSKDGGYIAYLRKCEKMFAWNDEGSVWSRICRSGTIQVWGHWWDNHPSHYGEQNTQYLLRIKVGNDDYLRFFLEGRASY